MRLNLASLAGWVVWGSGILDAMLVSVAFAAPYVSAYSASASVFLAGFLAFSFGLNAIFCVSSLIFSAMFIGPHC